MMSQDWRNQGGEQSLRAGLAFPVFIFLNGCINHPNECLNRLPAVEKSVAEMVVDPPLIKMESQSGKETDEKA